MYPRVKYGLADGHDNEAADRTEPPTVAAEEADQPGLENAATAASVTASGLAAAVSA
jgi:hypothetical protein